MKITTFITRILTLFLIAGLLAGLLLSARTPTPVYATNNDVDPGFDSSTGANGLVRSLAVQNDGKVLIGGLFTTYNGVARNHIARLNTDGSLDTTFDPGSGTSGQNGNVMAIAVQSDGQILIGGAFTTYNGVARSGIARLNADGSLDTSFDPGTGLGGSNPYPMTIVVQSDGKILIGGWFPTYNGVARSCIVRINADGSLDTTFDSSTGANAHVNAIVVKSDGQILIGGWFTTYNGVTLGRIARLNADGSLDTTFNSGTGANNTVYALAVQSDGQILIGGTFTTYNGVGRSRFTRLNADGSLDTTFLNTGVGGTVYSIIVQNNGKILISNGIVRLNTDGSLDTTFGSGGANSTVYAIAVQSNGQILICGDFTAYGAVARNRIARLGGPDMVLSSPAVEAANVLAGTTDLVVYRLNVSVTNQWAAGAILTSLTVTPGGTYLPADLTANSFKLRYSADATLDAGDPTLSTRAIVASGSPLAFTGLSQTIAKDSTGYLFVTVDVALSITGNRTLSIGALALSNVTFSGGSKSGVLTAGGTQTFITSIYADPAGICHGNIFCYTSLQAAVEAAGPNCLVTVYGGTYAESVTLNKNTQVRLVEDATITGSLTLAVSEFHLLNNTLTLGGDFTNITTTFDVGTGTVVLNGSALQTIGGAGVTTFNHLTIANTSGLTPAVKLKTDAVVNGTLTLQAGVLGVYAETFTLNGPVNTTGGSMARLLSTTTYAQAGPGQNVAPGQYGHLAFNDQPKTLPGSGTVSIKGDFDPGAASGHTVAGSTVAFNGSGTQTIAHDVALNDVNVASGVTLTTAANVTVGGALTNNGRTKETKAVVDGAGALSFGLANIAVDVTTRGSLASLEVIRRDQSHPNATGTIQTGKWWEITPTGGGYTATLTLPTDFVPDDKDKVCRYTGAGYAWDCDMSSFDAALHTVTRAGVTAFSDWAAGNNSNPTAVEVRLLKAQSPAVGWGALLGLAGLTLMICIGWLLMSRKRL